MAHTLAPSGHGVSRRASRTDEIVDVRVDFGRVRSTYLQEQEPTPDRRAALQTHEGGRAMRFIIIVRANRDTEAGATPAKELARAMAAYHEQLVKAGVLLDANALQPSSQGFRLRWQDGRRTLVDGPFAQAQELVAGYTVIQVKSRAEGVEWAKRFPAPFGEGQDGEIEVRPLYELDELGPTRSIDRFRKMPISTRE
jgi:hypothetical protein